MEVYLVSVYGGCMVVAAGWRWPKGLGLVVRLAASITHIGRLGHRGTIVDGRTDQNQIQYYLPDEFIQVEDIQIVQCFLAIPATKHIQ